ncbi:MULTISPECIES: Gfo/Idh/MocA family protein [Dietzia]|uniref:Gfo/Idh/MocA family protein n=1 Tax=Dietzia TaxID=37914 RepID=UPI0015F9A57F|nr:MULTISPECIES: Gfo/Idh/MocA family oxidoreductase [Dietzia]MBB1036652.1 Gfo/Idh/MocA family oxidoreductase [Dietzia natronolimnaea]
MANLRAGLIGLGMMGRHHARVLGSLEGVDLVAAVDPGGDKHNAMGPNLVVPSIQQLLKRNLDYCVVAVPTAFHEESALELAEAGVHTLVEKPLAHDAEAAQRIVDAFSSRGLVGGVGHIERYNSAIQQARSRISAGDLGDIYQVATRRQGPFPARIADVGVVKDLGTHDLDLTSWITQQSYKRVSAQTRHQSGRPHEDLVTITAQLDGGTLANHLVNWLSPLKERTTVITGEKGTLVADTLTADLTYFANGNIPTTWSELSQFRGVSEGDITRFSFLKPEPLRSEHEAFRDAVKGKSHRHVSMEEGVHVIRVTDAVLISADGGETVRVDTA